MTKNFDKESLKQFKEYKGGPSEELMTHYKYTNKLVRAVRDAIKKQGLQTVPEIAKATGYPTHEVYFAINALRKYEDLEIVDKSEEYPKFAFKE